MGGDRSKQYLTLGDRPILAHTLALFDTHPSIDHLWLVVPEKDRQQCHEEMVVRHGFSKVRGIIAGGAERQESVGNGLRACGAAADDIVLVHDGVRPFFDPQLIPTLLEKTRRDGACIVAAPLKETVKEVENGTIVATPERQRLWLAQTPQAFRADLLHRAYALAQDECTLGTDDASLVERLPHPVTILQGDYRNIKITTIEDLILARAYLTPPPEDTL